MEYLLLGWKKSPTVLKLGKTHHPVIALELALSLTGLVFWQCQFSRDNSRVGGNTHNPGISEAPVICGGATSVCSPHESRHKVAGADDCRIETFKPKQ